jgi:hypothetical protein
MGIRGAAEQAAASYFQMAVSPWTKQQCSHKTNLIMTLTSMLIHPAPIPTQLAQFNLSECYGSSQLRKDFWECII